ncbi:Protein FAM217B [Merluccius polli]|uniref:Protein FAM217B n=1 Tax=Merluccius polli TaxID=89951 RepID=A0AA47M832_MERPO|nr:Protein FAM217B [Merluccius polli]
MGPIMQERSASTTLKRVSSKDKIKGRNAENTGLVTTSSKKGNKVKKAGGQMKNGLPGPGQEKDTEATVHKGTQSRGGGKVKAAATRNTSKLSSPQDEGPVKPQEPKHSSTRRKEEKREMRRLAPCCDDADQNRSRMGKSRRALSLPLSPISGLRHMPMRSPAPTPEALHRHYNQKEDDTDSASDLSDSERLPILPSPCTPCTPPHLDLRAEVINTSDFPPDFPGPCGAVGEVEDDGSNGDAERPAFSYPDFLPPPFNSWSLRQLAVFLHTEGRSAPRPKPVGPLEKYLERLLQLEWHQIQTVQAESSRTAGSRHRQLGFPSSTAAAAAAHSPRPHTAPPTRLNSPKGPRQGQRAPPFVSLNTPTSPASTQQQSRYPVCPQCHIRYPLCNGSCSPYAYQRHSRLSPLMERRSRAGAPSKRSSSESRATSSDGRAAGGQGGGGGGGAQTAVSPSTAKSHVKQMQSAGNVRKPHHQEPGASGGGSQAASGGGGGGSQVASSGSGGSQVASAVGGGSQVASGGGSQVASSGSGGSQVASAVGGGSQVASSGSGGSQVASAVGGGSQVASGGGSQVTSSGQVTTARGQQKKSRIRANSETDVKKEPGSGGTKGPNVEKRITSGGKRELNAAKKAERDWHKTETGGTATKASMKRTAKELPSLSKPLPGSKPNGKAKNVHFVAK